MLPLLVSGLVVLLAVRSRRRKGFQLLLGFVCIVVILLVENVRHGKLFPLGLHLGSVDGGGGRGDLGLGLGGRLLRSLLETVQTVVVRGGGRGQGLDVRGLVGRVGIERDGRVGGVGEVRGGRLGGRVRPGAAPSVSARQELSLSLLQSPLELLGGVRQPGVGVDGGLELLDLVQLLLAVLGVLLGFSLPDKRINETMGLYSKRNGIGGKVPFKMQKRQYFSKNALLN